VFAMQVAGARYEATEPSHVIVEVERSERWTLRVTIGSVRTLDASIVLGPGDEQRSPEVSVRRPTAPTAAELLEKFAAWRAEDRKGVTRFTDGLVKLFGSDKPGVGLVRNFGLLLFDLSPAAKRALSRVSWGFAGRMPRLARGLPLE